MKNKRILFRLILLSPALLLAGVVLFIAVDLVKVQAVDTSEIYESLADHLIHDRSDSFPLPEEIYAVREDKKTLFLFGESSLVLSDGWTFPDYLAQTHDDLHVVNFGLSGIDSFDIKQRVKEALSVYRPDVMVLYYGHNDFNNAYQGHIIPTYFQQFKLLLGLANAFHDKQDPVGVLLPDDPYWFTRLARPRIFQLFERAGLVDFEARDFDRINQLIAHHYESNTAAIIDMAAGMRIPVILITPVGNLHAEPFGDFHRTTALYRKGMSSSDYSEHLSLLRQARDSEFFTYDLRAKTMILDYLRTVRRPGVYVLDLEKKLEEMRFGFDYDEFLDYFHFRDQSHRLLAEIIYDFMVQKKILAPGQQNRS